MATRQLLLETGALSIGRFICPPGDARWSRENWIGPEHHVVFPSRSVVIDQAGVGRIVANPNRVVLYDAGRTYRRELLSPDGDLATYIALRPELVQEMLEAAAGSERSFRRGVSWLPARDLIRLRMLVAAIESGTIDALTAEEASLGFVDALLSSGTRAPVRAPAAATTRWPAPPHKRRATRRHHAEIVHDAERVLSQRYAEPLTLAEVARTVGSSPYHLARVFRGATGQSLHGYREQIRLRTALDRLARPGPGAARGLAALASELGFASHAHLARRFRIAFGTSPSRIRNVAASGVSARTIDAELRTIVQGRKVPRH